MESSKKVLLSTIGVAILIVLLTGVTFAFFNYTRTGTANTIRVGRISFVTNQSETINLTNVFPIDSNDVGTDTDNVDQVVIEIEGDTDYADGIEYLVSSVDSNIYTSEGQLVPISLDFDVDGLGTENANYFTARDSKDANMYKILAGDTLVGDQMLLVGYIKKNTTNGTAEGIDGSITVSAYFDKDKILISDTFDGTESDNMGTTNEMAKDKTALTTTEWNAISSSGVSFKIKVEANEGIWVKGSLEDIMKVQNLGIDTEQGVDFSKTSEQDGLDGNGTNGVYTRAGTQNDDYPIMYYRGAVENNNVLLNNNCWKAVRTTDTGGVKLIYNGELKSVYEFGDNLSRNDYKNVVSEPSENFVFDSTDNSWNRTITTGVGYIYFYVPTDQGYKLEMTTTTGNNAHGQFSFGKNNVTVWSSPYTGFHGASFNYTMDYGTLASTDIIQWSYSGYSDAENPVVVKLRMLKNDVAIPQSDYTIIKNGIGVFSFDENEKKWTAPNNGTISFNFGEPGDYFIYSSYATSFFTISLNGVSVSTGNVNQNVKLLDLQPTDQITITGRNNSAIPEFYVIKGERLSSDCNNENNETFIMVNGQNLSSFNSSYSSSISRGYMFGSAPSYNSSNWINGAKFGSDFIWDGTNYTLVDATETEPNNTHHYSCNLTEANATCTSLRYVYYVSNSTKYYITLTNGNSIEDLIAQIQKNENPSNAKTRIDSWYVANNMMSITNKLEDTIWCDDRSFGDGNNNGWISNGGDLSTPLYYGAYQRGNLASNTSTVKNQPSLSCVNKNDRFTVNTKAGNGALTYPIALLTADEIVLAGATATVQNQTFYLKSGGTPYWTMSPSSFSSTYYDMFAMDGSGRLFENAASMYSITYGLRPAISLKPGQLIRSGSGTVADPYVIE